MTQTLASTSVTFLTLAHAHWEPLPAEGLAKLSTKGSGQSSGKFYRGQREGDEKKSRHNLCQILEKILWFDPSYSSKKKYKLINP